MRENNGSQEFDAEKAFETEIRSNFAEFMKRSPTNGLY